MVYVQVRFTVHDCAVHCTVYTLHCSACTITCSITKTFYLRLRMILIKIRRTSLVIHFYVYFNPGIESNNNIKLNDNQTFVEKLFFKIRFSLFYSLKNVFFLPIYLGRFREWGVEYVVKSLVFCHSTFAISNTCH